MKTRVDLLERWLACFGKFSVRRGSSSAMGRNNGLCMRLVVKCMRHLCVPADLFLLALAFPIARSVLVKSRKKSVKKLVDDRDNQLDALVHTWNRLRGVLDSSSFGHLQAVLYQSSS